MENRDKEMKLLKLKSIIGLIIFGASIVGAYFYISHALFGLISIFGLLIGWIVFSVNHTKLYSIKLDLITAEYITGKIQRDNQKEAENNPT